MDVTLEQPRQTTRRWLRMALPLVCLVMSHGCQTTKPAEQATWVQTPIVDVADVAGKWDGLMRRIPPDRRDDWVTVAIAPDGRYEFSSLRTIGVFTGHGEFMVNDGKLLSKSERGTVEAALYETGGQRMLKAKGRAADGTEYTAEVKPAK
ncbi:MAG TPA: hypothetical protein VL329_10150 [Nitrospiraceae bacterium]|jgi:hypothetical protein|nr:hypothetical protein [Nitrospiraceae bacterium]